MPSVRATNQEVSVVGRRETSLGVLCSDQNIFVTWRTWCLPLDVLVTLRTDLGALRSQSRIRVLRTGVAECSEPISRFIDRRDVVGHPNSSGLNRRRVDPAGAVLSEMLTDISSIILANDADLGFLGAPAQVRMTSAKLSDILDELLEAVPDYFYRLGAINQLRIFPPARWNDAGDDAKLDTHYILMWSRRRRRRRQRSGLDHAHDNAQLRASHLRRIGERSHPHLLRRRYRHQILRVAYVQLGEIRKLVGVPGAPFVKVSGALGAEVFPKIFTAVAVTV